MNVDMTAVNKAIKCTRHVIPTVEELRYQMNGSAFVSKLDMNHGYNQFELDEDSRYVMVFCTHQGLRQFKCLTFGTTSAAEVFHDEMSQTLSGILQAANIYDDVIIFGRTQRELDLALIQVLQRLSNCWLTLGLSKCQLNAKSVKFFGIIFHHSICPWGKRNLWALFKAHVSSKLLKFITVIWGSIVRSHIFWNSQHRQHRHYSVHRW